jgi:hypothetical protein
LKLTSVFGPKVRVIGTSVAALGGQDAADPRRRKRLLQGEARVICSLRADFVEKPLANGTH